MVYRRLHSGAVIGEPVRASAEILGGDGLPYPRWRAGAAKQGRAGKHHGSATVFRRSLFDRLLVFVNAHGSLCWRGALVQRPC